MFFQKKLKFGLAIGLVLIGLITGISINHTNVNIFDNCLADTVTGWDPGLTKKLVAGIHPNNANYFESCPNGPNGKCYGEILAGKGFYTIANDELCKINSGDNFYLNEYNENVSCPFEFYWKEDNDDVVANLKIDTTDFTSPITPNIYLGIQENVPYGDLYLGVDKIADINEIDKVHLKFKASYCFGPATDQADIDSYRRARFLYHIVWYNPIKENSKLWRKYMESHNQNFPYKYHNGGIWPFVRCFFVCALASVGKKQEAENELEKIAIANKLSNWRFTEWFHGKTFKPMGMRGQSWNAGMFLFTYHYLEFSK